jgi:hypothetical protein
MTSTPHHDGARIPTTNPIDKLLRFLERKSAAAFYGRISVGFQHGKVTDVKIEENRKLDEL